MAHHVENRWCCPPACWQQTVLQPQLFTSNTSIILHFHMYFLNINLRKKNTIFPSNYRYFKNSYIEADKCFVWARGPSCWGELLYLKRGHVVYSHYVRNLQRSHSSFLEFGLLLLYEDSALRMKGGIVNKDCQNCICDRHKFRWWLQCYHNKINSEETMNNQII